MSNSSPSDTTPQNRGSSTSVDAPNTHQRRFTEVDLRNADYTNMSSAVFANTLRILFEPNAQDNPLPTMNTSCYVNGEKLPPQLTRLFDGDLGYGHSADNIDEYRQRHMIATTYSAIVNWFTKHADSVKKRQNMMSLITDTFTVGKSITDLIPMIKDEDMDDYLARLKERLNGRPEPESEPETDLTASKVVQKSKKTSAPVESKKKTAPVTEKKGKKPALMVESDSESGDLADDTDDTDAAVSESSEIDLSSESEVPKKKVGGAKKKPVRR
jgi:hypothetical protein